MLASIGYLFVLCYANLMRPMSRQRDVQTRSGGSAGAATTALERAHARADQQPSSQSPSASASVSAQLLPKPHASPLVRYVTGRDESGQPTNTAVVVERPLTIFLNNQEIVTTMTLGDLPDYLALGFLRNQNMLTAADTITAIDVDDELGVVVVRTKRATNYEAKLKQKVQTSGCAQGTQFGDMMEGLAEIRLNPDTRVTTSNMRALLKAVNTTPSRYLAAGAIHGCVLATAEDCRMLAYVEDVGRHNAVDKIAGWMMQHGIAGDDKVFFTTGRLTSEMVIKTVQMRIPILLSRSGFTHAGVELAEQTGLTLVGRARGKRFTALTGIDRIVDDGAHDGANHGAEAATGNGDGG